MRFNEQELIGALAFQTPEWEGRIMYKPPKGGGTFVVLGGSGGNADYKERWFRLRANCLFYWRIAASSSSFTASCVIPRCPAPGTPPMGVLVLEDSQVQHEGFHESVHAFSITFGEDERKHMFLADSHRHAQQWVSVLKRGRYDGMRDRLIGLQIKLVNRTGRDPLMGTGFENNPLYCNKVLPEDVVVAPNFLSLPPGGGADDCGVSPKAKPRKAKVKSTFQSHVVERWENRNGQEDEDAGQDYSGAERKASFQSHVKVPEGKLLDFSS